MVATKQYDYTEVTTALSIINNYFISNYRRACVGNFVLSSPNLRTPDANLVSNLECSSYMLKLSLTIHCRYVLRILPNVYKNYNPE